MTDTKTYCKGYVAQMTNPLSDPRVRAIVEELRNENQKEKNKAP